MLKGHVFKEQIFGNQIFALFINTFLNGKNGIINNYKKGMAVTYSGSTLTVQSGAICIQGRFLEEDTSTDVAVGTDTAYCKLVLEIDLNKENTESEFNQGTYKIVKSTSGYPTLTQNDIIGNNSGIYQYELARFKTSISGITDFQDMRTFLDFNSIYTTIQEEYNVILGELKEELANVKDESAYLLKEEKIILVDNSWVRVEAIKTGRICTIIAYSKTTISSALSFSFDVPNTLKPQNQEFYYNNQINWASNTGTARGYSELGISKANDISYFNTYSLDGIHQWFYNTITYCIDD